MKDFLAATTVVLSKACIGLLCLMAWMPAWSQGFPTKPVRIVIPNAAGGGSDVVARIVSPKLTEQLGQQVLIDNRGGAAGAIGTEFVIKSPPDGYTLYLGTLGNFSVNPSLYEKLPYDISRDLVPVTTLVNVPYFLFVNAALPVKSVPELIAYARARPGQVFYSSAGNGSAQHLAGELFQAITGVKLVHVPYKGGGPAMTDLIGGQVQMTFSSGLSGFPQVKAGRIRALAATAAKRSTIYPDVPSLAESLPGFEFRNWIALAAPTGTPPVIINRLNSDVVRAVTLPEVRSSLAVQGAEPIADTAEESANFIKAETAKWSKIVKDTGMKPD